MLSFSFSAMWQNTLDMCAEYNFRNLRYIGIFKLHTGVCPAYVVHKLLVYIIAVSFLHDRQYTQLVCFFSIL
jgi:uncharacterized protein YjeT (DUF2065 family)